MLKPDESGKWSIPVTAQESYTVIRIDEID
jgi:hypothetical protein